ncbi:MAG: DUF1320 domain-containing protein [Betaproteobacteria bacterium]
MYISFVQLAELPGAQELSQVASTEHQAVVDPQLMEITLRDGDRTSYDADEIALADAALERIGTAVTETDALIEAYIARRVSLPLDPVPSVLVQIARAIVRYELHKHLIAGETVHPIVRDYKDKLRLLEAIRDGKVTLGVADPAAVDGGLGDVRFDSSEPVFGRDQLRSFR